MPASRGPAETITRALAVPAFVAFVGSALGHLLRPDAMARHANWRRSDWYQREIALFDVAHAFGVAAVARSPAPNRLYLSVLSLTALGLGLNHAAAIRAGDSGGLLNWSAAVGNTLAGTLGLVLAGASEEGDVRPGTTG